MQINFYNLFKNKKLTIFTLHKNPTMKRISLFITLFFFLATCYSQKQNITLEDLWQRPTFVTDYPDELRSMNDGESYTVMEDEGIVKYDYATGKKRTVLVDNTKLVPEGKTSPVAAETYGFSNDETKVLVSTGREQIYRHSGRSDFYVWDMKTKKLSAVSTGGKQMYATFSPDGNKVAFVRDNNLFVKDLVQNKETAITSDGKWGEIINGATDWVYEEEFSFDRGYQWNADGTKIAFYRFDESAVKEYTLEKYGSLYPSQYKYKYPKAGEANAIVNIFIYDTKTGKSTRVDIGTETDQYIPRVKWTADAGTLSFIRLNRLQNKLELMLADGATGRSKNLLTETCDTYFEITDNYRFLKNGLVWSSDIGGYNHFYYYDTNGKLIGQITKGDWDIDALKGVDEKNGMLYYTSAEASPTQRDLYCIKLDGTGKKKISARPGTNDADFSAAFRYYVGTFSDANTPPEVAVYSNDGKKMRTLSDNEKLKKKLDEYSLSKKEFFRFKTSGGTELNGYMIKPVNFDPNKKYPVFMYLYGGPGANQVEDQWGGGTYLWFQMLAEKGYLIACVDNRGTGYRGKKFRDCTYRKLGTLETEDQLEAVKYYGTLPYVDRSRIGIFGWSYGGYMSTLCILRGADLLKMAIAVAPVTSWRFYDSIYTERYMGLPKDNDKGYDDTAPVKFANLLKGKYLLIHGTADDNVHFQNSVEMVNALVKANKPFDVMYYPDKNHGIYGGNTRLHLYTKMTNYILENL